MKLLLILLVFLGGCEYIPNQKFEIETVSGEIITLRCPVVDAGRSTFTYLIDGYCTVSK